jgi:hypothetical protein
METVTQSAYSSIPPKRTQVKPIGYVAYAAMASGLIFYVLTLWIQVFIDTRRARTVSIDALSEAHRHWRLRSSLLFLIWSICRHHAKQLRTCTTTTESVRLV